MTETWVGPDANDEYRLDDMTDTDRLAAALRTQLHDAISGWFGCEHEGPQGEWPCEDFFARLMGSPTLKAAICPDPDAHVLAAALRRLPEEMRLRWTTLQPRGQEWLVTKDGFVYGTGPTPEVAITAALEDKP